MRASTSAAAAANAPAAVVLDGSRLTVAQVAAVAREEVPVALAAAALERARAAHRVAAEVAQRRPVYGRTTGVGANRTIAVPDADGSACGSDHGLRLLRSHTVGAGPLLSRDAIRAMLVVRLNQLAAGGSGVDPDLLGVLAEVLNRGLLPPVRRYGAIGTGDLPALAATALCILGERPWSGGSMPPYRIDPLDALAFINSNAATVGEAALACHDLLSLLDAGLVVAALSFAGLGGSTEPYAAPVHAARPAPGPRAVAARLRALLSDSLTEAEPRIQDPFCLRTLPQVQGAAQDALAALEGAVSAEMNAAGENPLVDAAAGEVFHHGAFLTAGLTVALDSARAALYQAAALSVARLAALMEPSLTGLRAFLADGPPASSGAMMLEYVAHAALADLRHQAYPAALGGAVLSLGVEEHASFATQAAWRLTAALPAYQTVLACELVAAVRALRLKGASGTPTGSGGHRGAGGLRAAFAQAAAALDPRTEDRPLDADVAVAAALLPALAELGRE
jgi:histidine ammonia-lyase